MLVRSSLFVIGLSFSAVACGSTSRPVPRSPNGAPASTSSATTTATAATVKSDLRVFTLRDFQIHQGQTHGRWFRRAAQGWEAADCTESFSPDFGGHDVSCGAWTPVSAALVPAVERALAAGEEVHCASRKALCDDLGLVAEQR